MILGSQSAGRKKVLEKMGYDFEVLPSNIDEKTIRSDSPQKLTLALANAKADSLLPKLPKDAILITSDQVVVFEGKIREKPANKDEARFFLSSYSGTFAETISAVVVVNSANEKRAGGIDVAKIWFKSLPENIIADYIASDDPYYHSGGFDHEHPLIKPFVDRIDGDPDSVTGLPKELTEKLIKEIQ